ncbi:MAG: hypothetical protein WC375_03290 [Methanomassiliicoccales archaeon]|jgi:hypothetical protein
MQSTSSLVNPSVNSVNDSWETRIQNASSFLGLKPEDVESILKEFGVDKEPAGLEMLSDEEVTPFGDLRRVFCDEKGIAVPKLRMAMKFLRGPANSKKTDSIDPELLDLQQKFGLKMKLADYGIDAIIPYYNPTNSNHPITRELKRRYGDKAIIAFKPDSNTVAIEETVNYATDLENGYPSENTIMVDGELVRLYAVGQVPDQQVEEDPLFSGEPLKRGRSVVNRVNWEKIPVNIRQFCRLVVDAKEINVNDKFAVRKLMEEALKGVDALKEMFPDVALAFREKSKENELPKLTMKMNDASRRKQNPFSINRQF